MIILQLEQVCTDKTSELRALVMIKIIENQLWRQLEIVLGIEIQKTEKPAYSDLQAL